MRFADTNVLIYSISAWKEPRKAQRAIEIIRDGRLALSVQVFQEFYWQSTRPTRPGYLSHLDALTFIKNLRIYPVQAMTLDILDAALATCQRYQISYWDAAIVEAARALGCDTIFTEDLQDGQDFGGLRVVNPFATI